MMARTGAGASGYPFFQPENFTMRQHDSFFTAMLGVLTTKVL